MTPEGREPEPATEPAEPAGSDAAADSPTPEFGGTHWDRRDSLTLGGLALACLFLFVWGLGSYPLWDPWESMHGAAMVEISDRGDRVTPWLDGQPNWSQPILIYWAMAVPMAIWGTTEFAARLPSAVAALIGVLLLFYALRRLRGYPTALMAAGILATMPLYVYMGRQAMPDMLMTSALVGIMGFFALARFQDDRRERHVLLGFACLGLATMAKGPLAVALTASALGAFALFQRDAQRLTQPGQWWNCIREFASRYSIGKGVLVYLLVATPWHLAVLIKHGSGVMNSFLLDEGWTYFTSAVGGDDGTSDFYARNLFHGLYPWISLVPLSLIHLFHGKQEFDEDAGQKWYFAAWGLTLFAFFTLAGTKLSHYLLPITPPMAVLAALAFEAWFKERTPFWVAPGLLISIPFALLPVRDFLIEGDRNMFRIFTDPAVMGHPGLYRALTLFIGAWVVVVLLAVVRRRSWVVAGLALAIVYGHVAYMSHTVLPAQSTDRTLRSYTDLFERIRENDAELLFYGEPRYSVDFYFGAARFQRFATGTAEELANRVANKPHAYVIAESDEIRELSRELQKTGRRWFPLADDHPDYVLLTNSQAAIRAR